MRGGVRREERSDREVGRRRRRRRRKIVRDDGRGERETMRDVSVSETVLVRVKC